MTKKCVVAQADAAAPLFVAMCIFAAPEIVAGAVIVVGAVVVAAAIQEGIDAYQRNAARERAKLKTQPTPAEEPLANQTPGMDVSVGGIRFDALQVGVRVLWEIKTHRFDVAMTSSSG